MLVGCLAPLLLIFVLPLAGVREGWVIPIALAAMLACHFVAATFSWRRGAGGAGGGGGGGANHDGQPQSDAGQARGGADHAHH